MALSQMEVFNKYYMPATIETLAQMVDKFNEASRGTVVLTTAGFEGDFIQESFFAAIHSAQRRVNRYGSNDAVTPTDLTQLKANGVKVAGGFGPVRYEPSQMTWLQHPTVKGVEVASRNFAEALLADQVNTILACLVAAIENVGSALVNDVSLSASVSYSALNLSHEKFGDRSSALAATFMNGKAFHFMIEGNLANAQELFRAGNVRVIDILGQLVVVTDAPALSDTGKLKMPSLVPGAGVVYDGGDVISNIETGNGKQRIETTLQMDYSFGVGVKGYSWDTENGGKSPTDAALATGSNWDKVVSDNKHTAGVLAITNDSVPGA